MRLLVPSIFLISMCACDFSDVPPSTKEIQADKAAAAAEQIHFDENAEIDNIKHRLELTSSPGLLGYIVLLNDAGQPIRYTTVKGKVTSGGKRLTAPYELKRIYAGDGSDSRYDTVEAPSDEGTYGHSGDYIYFWTESGQYIQWNGAYMYSDQPIRLSVKPLVIEIRDDVHDEQALSAATSAHE